MLYILIQNTFLDLFGFSLKTIKYTFFSGTKSQLIHGNDKHRIVYKVCKKQNGLHKTARKQKSQPILDSKYNIGSIEKKKNPKNFLRFHYS